VSGAWVAGRSFRGLGTERLRTAVTSRVALPEPQPKRKLAAILSADVVGYSRLMSADEAETVATLLSPRVRLPIMGAAALILLIAAGALTGK
jgi:class 3 adenylate cyclase